MMSKSLLRSSRRWSSRHASDFESGVRDFRRGTGAEHMIRSRIIISALSLLAITTSLSGCLNPKEPERWINTDNEDFGITAKQGYIGALDKINGTYINHPKAVFLTSVQSKQNDVTRFGKATFWGFYFCILNSTDQYRNLTVEIFSNGTRNLH